MVWQRARKCACGHSLASQGNIIEILKYSNMKILKHSRMCRVRQKCCYQINGIAFGSIVAVNSQTLRANNVSIIAVIDGKFTCCIKEGPNPILVRSRYLGSLLSNKTFFKDQHRYGDSCPEPKITESKVELLVHQIRTCKKLIRSMHIEHLDVRKLSQFQLPKAALEITF